MVRKLLVFWLQRLLLTHSPLCSCLFLASIPSSPVKDLSCLHALVCPSTSAKDTSMIRNKWVSTSAGCVPSDFLLSYLALLSKDSAPAFPRGDSKLLFLLTSLHNEPGSSLLCNLMCLTQEGTAVAVCLCRCHHNISNLCTVICICLKSS